MSDVEHGDELRNPRLNLPERVDQVSSQVDPAQGFEVTDALPGEDDADDGYESALAGVEGGEPEAESDLLDNLDTRAGIGQGFHGGAANELALDAVDEPAVAEGERAVAAPEDSAQR